MLSAIGLALDLVGAVMLSLGLFTHSRELHPGLVRGPADVAQDAAFGTVGATLLMSGFVLQGLQYVGVSVDCGTAQTLSAVGATISITMLASWLGYGLIYIKMYEREAEWVRHHTAAKLPPTRRVPQGRLGWRFWRHEHVTS